MRRQQTFDREIPSGKGRLFQRTQAFLSRLLSGGKHKSIPDPGESQEMDAAPYGFIYGRRHQRHLISWCEHLRQYTAETETSVLLFTIDRLDLEEKRVEGILVNKGEMTMATLPIPKYIYNFVFHSKPSSVKTMRYLRTLHGMTVINPINRFHQSVILDMVSALGGDYLLPCSVLSPSVLEEYARECEYLFLLPESGVIKRLALLIEKYEWQEGPVYHVHHGSQQQLIQGSELYGYLRKVVQSKQYMVMKGTRLVEWNRLPLEARVYVQKGASGDWELTGLIAKNELFAAESIHAGSGDDLLKVLVHCIPAYAKILLDRFQQSSLNICTHLDHFIPDMGSCFLDYVIGEQGQPYFIGFGGWEQKDFLARLQDQGPWKKYLEQCLAYLKHRESIEVRRASV